MSAVLNNDQYLMMSQGNQVEFYNQAAAAAASQPFTIYDPQNDDSLIRSQLAQQMNLINLNKSKVIFVLQIIICSIFS